MRIDSQVCQFSSFELTTVASTIKPRTESLPVPALQNADLASLDVNFHEVNGPVLDMKIANLGEPDDLNLMRRCGESGGGETVRDSGIERRIFSEA